MKNIVIVESPAKAKTIEKYLGPDFKVLASFGHVRDLPSKDGSVDPDDNFAMHYAVPAKSEKTIKEIASAVSKADAVYLATDLDREGEAISWHVLEEIKKRVKNFERLTVKRIEFSEITKKAVQHAVANPRDLAMDLVNAQQARRALDYLVGFNLSPVLWRKVRGGLSAGRVQSVALRLICEREDEIDAFKTQEYWSIEGVFIPEKAKGKLTARLDTFAGTKAEKFSFKNQEEAETALSSLRSADYMVADIQKKQVRRFPAAPFITSTLQMDAARKIGFSAKRTMSTAQRLYEAGYITYMRTDSVNLAAEAVQALRSLIHEKYGDKFVPEKPNTYKTKTQNAQEAHEAIRPTDPTLTPEGAASKMEADQAKLYRLIWQRTVASQMAPALLDQTAITLADTAKKGHSFKATGTVIAFAGFLSVYKEGTDDDTATDDEGGPLLPAVEQGEGAKAESIEAEQHFTEPPPRYSEATLVKALEEHGIGRPSTYAAIVSTIQDRGYVKLEKKRFYPEDVGRIVTRFLVEHFNRYVDLNFTATMEEELDEVSRGEKAWQPMLAEFWGPFKAQIEDKIGSVKKSDVVAEDTGETCPECKQGTLIIRLSRYGRFKGCSRYPECKYIENMNKPAEEAVDENGNPLPPKPQAKDTGILCPACKKKNILERPTRTGKIFYGCGGFPRCKFAFWDKPIEEPCPACKAPFITEKVLKDGSILKRCVQKGCDWQDPPAKTSSKKPAAKEAGEGAKTAAAKAKTTKASKPKGTESEAEANKPARKAAPAKAKKAE